MSKINKVVVKGVSYDIEDAYARNAIQQNTVKINASIKNVDVSPNTDDVELDLEDNTGSTTHVVFPAATTEKAGVMSAEDKRTLDAVNSVINIGEYQNIQAVLDACKQIALNNPEISIIKYSVKAGVTYNSGVVFQSYHYNDAIVTQYYLYGGGQKHECNVRHIVSDGTTDEWQPIQIFTSYKFENGTLYGYKYGESESEQNKVAIVSIPIGSAVAELIQEVTYSELVALRDNAGLVAGMKYRITDYVTTTVQKDTMSANHPFDVIVEAVSENELSELARATQHEGDTYFDGNDLGAWQLWYDIENDTSKYEWADTENGKGVIYRMIDEKRNDCPYDFKNILFYNNKYTLNTTSDKYYYTFSYVVKGVLYDGTVEKRVTTCHSNSMRVYKTSTSRIHKLNINTWQNTSFKTYCYSNTFGDNCYSNTFGDNCYSNTFGNNCYYNTFGDNCYSNTFGNNCNNNTFGDYCYNNTFGDYCSYNTFGNNCDYNTFGNNCYYNTFGDNCYNKQLNAEKTSITLNEEYYDDGTNALVPIRHPDLSTQPSILPYKFMGQYVYEQLIPMGFIAGAWAIESTAATAIPISEMSLLEISAVTLYQGKLLPIQVQNINYYDEYICLIFGDNNEGCPRVNGIKISIDNVYARIVYTTMPEEGGYYGYGDLLDLPTTGVLIKYNHNGDIDNIKGFSIKELFDNDAIYIGKDYWHINVSPSTLSASIYLIPQTHNGNDIKAKSWKTYNPDGSKFASGEIDASGSFRISINNNVDFVRIVLS